MACRAANGVWVGAAREEFLLLCVLRPRTLGDRWWKQRRHPCLDNRAQHAECCWLPHAWVLGLAQDMTKAVPPSLQAGSVYGVSVFADEYGKWGTALQGMALQETVNRKQTKYFP